MSLKHSIHQKIINNQQNLSLDMYQQILERQPIIIRLHRFGTLLKHF